MEKDGLFIDASGTRDFTWLATVRLLLLFDCSCVFSRAAAFLCEQNISVATDNALPQGTHLGHLQGTSGELRLEGLSAGAPSKPQSGGQRWFANKHPPPLTDRPALLFHSSLHNKGRQATGSD